MKKILFVGNGSHQNLADTFWRIEVLKNKFDVTYLGFSENKVSCADGFKLIEIDGFGNSIKSRFKLFCEFRKLVSKINYDLIVINYFFGASLLSFPSRRAIIDIRSSIIKRYYIERLIHNTILRIECSFYAKKLLISEGLRNFLFFKKNNTFIFPLGARKFDLKPKTFEHFSLLYIGTLNLRNIADTVKGFYFFKRENPHLNLKYYIIGYGKDIEINILKTTIKKYMLEQCVFFLGEMRFPDYVKYFEICNVGVSYIPKTSYYDFQPPTKTFEYLVNGLSVIATSTFENLKVINDFNGVLINDNATGFKLGLDKLLKLKQHLNSKSIAQSSIEYQWENIVNNHIQQLIN